jgi:hypothetical protein
MSSFDPGKLGRRSGGGQPNKGPRAERVFLVVEKYETPAEGFHYAVGHRADKPDEKIKVRLNTVQERSADRPNDSIEKIKAQYVTGENTRDSIADKAKAGVKLLSFDDARRIGKGEDGVIEYRAHWPKTMSTDPQAEVMHGLAHVKLKEAGEYNGRHSPSQAYVEMMKSSVVVDKDSIDKVLSDALAIKDSQGRARDPLAIMRVMYEGKVVASSRVYPSVELTKVFDQNLGEHKEVVRKVDADKTINDLMTAKPGKSDMENRQLDIARAVIAGIKGLDEPKFNIHDESAIESVRNLYYGAKSGALQVEVIAAEKIDFGAESRKTYLNDKDRPQLAAYTIKEVVDETRVREIPGYTKTVLAVHRHPDGEPYAVFASPVQMYPKVQKLHDLPMNPVGEPALAAEAKTEVAKLVEPEAPVADGLVVDDDYDYAP